MTGVRESVGAPASAQVAASAASLPRRAPGDAGSPAAPSGEAARERGAAHAGHPSAAPDPSGRSGSLLDVFA